MRLARMTRRTTTVVLAALALPAAASASDWQTPFAVGAARDLDARLGTSPDPRRLSPCRRALQPALHARAD